MSESFPHEFPFVPLPPAATNVDLRRGGAAGVLADRVFLHASAYSSEETLTRLLSAISTESSGAVLVGTEKTGPSRAIKKLRRAGYQGILIADPGECARHYATTSQPFWLEEDALVPGRTLVDVIEHQLQSGATLAMTPTGYVPAGEPDVLRAVIGGAAALRDRNDTILAVPLDATWLDNANLAQTSAILRQAGMPLALMLGGQFNPAERTSSTIASLRQLYGDVPDIALFRTDLIGFDAVAHGGLAAAIGQSTTLRHLVEPDDRPEVIARKDRSPSVLYPDLGDWRKGSAIARWFGGKTAPACYCRVCGPAGKRLNSFLDGYTERSAQAHSVAVWTEWADGLLSHSESRARGAWWKNFCTDRVREHAILREQLKMPTATRGPLRPHQWLRACADLPT